MSLEFYASVCTTITTVKYTFFAQPLSTQKCHILITKLFKVTYGPYKQIELIIDSCLDFNEWKFNSSMWLMNLNSATHLYNIIAYLTV